MKRTDPCPDCGGSGRHATAIARHPEHVDPDGTVHPAYEGPAQCDLCGGTGKVSKAPAPVHQIRVPADHPHAKRIQELLEQKEPS